MLDRAKVSKALARVADKLFIEHGHHIDEFYALWLELAADPLFASRVLHASASEYNPPLWEGNLNAVFDVDQTSKPYVVYAIDGSQIYPDRHQGTACYLLNIGTVMLEYGVGSAHVLFSNEPYVYTGVEDDIDLSPEMVNCRRMILELQAAAHIKPDVITSSSALCCTLMDGSLIFWYLEPKEQKIQEHFLSNYLYSLEQLYLQRQLIASYISMPKSRELVQLIRYHLEQTTQETDMLQGIIDAHIMSRSLQPGQRTTIFYNRSAITKQYPDHLKPCFFYLHGGDEIGRVELPAWIAKDAAKVEQVAYIILDQMEKGRGYPVCLAEAHEQAVVKGPDRDFFYHLITRAGLEQKRRLGSSQKSMKKRRMGI